MKADLRLIITLLILVVVAFGSCKKSDGDTPGEKDQKPVTKTKSYKELWFMPAYAGTTDLHEIVIIWEDNKETSYRSYSQGTAMFLYDNDQPLLSVDDKVISSGRDGAAFPADPKDKFKITMDNGAVITGLPLKDAQIRIFHYRGENADLQSAKVLANQQAIVGAKNRKYEVLGDTP